MEKHEVGKSLHKNVYSLLTDYTWLGRRKMEGASTPQRHILIELSVTEAMSSEAVDIYRRVGFKGSPKFPPPFASS